MAQESGQRSNLWTYIIYPGDSAPDNYFNIIDSWHIPTLCSPVHDADINADDTEKKTHMHILMYFGAGQNKSLDQVKKFSDQLGGCRPQICHNRSGLVRYFIHKDNPEKHQYSADDLKSFAGFVYLDDLNNSCDEDILYMWFEDLIMDKYFYNMRDLMEFLRDGNYVNEKRFLRRHTIYIKCLLDGNFQHKNIYR